MDTAAPVKPNFLVIGSPKSGTSSLWDLLDQHPQIGLCASKEPQFFAIDSIYARGLDWYYAQFSHLHERVAIGEASTLYSMHPQYPHAADRIAEHLPAVRIIYIVRHPLQRLESHWLDGNAHVNVRCSFNDFVRGYDGVYLQASQYWMQISRYRRFVPDERILILFFDDMVRDPVVTAQRCYEFLGVTRDFHPQRTTPRNVSGTRPIDRPVFRSLKRFPKLVRAVRSLPMPVRTMLKKPFLRPARRPRWDPAVRRWAIEQLREDVGEFLSFYGKAGDYWEIE